MKKRILLGFFLAAVFINFLGPIIDPDFPFHLKTGEYIYQNREIPEDDPFSFYGEGIITDREKFTLSQYWITQILFFKLYTYFGPSGIILLRALVFSAFVFLIWYVLRKKGLYSSLLIAALITIMFQTSKVDRPQFFSFLFTLILILILERFREKPNEIIPLFGIPPLMLIWANMHAGFVFGIAVIVTYACAEALKVLIHQPALGPPCEKKPALTLVTISLLAILFSYLNPVVNSQILETFASHTEANWLYSSNREYISPVKEMGFDFGNRISASIFFVIFGYVCIITALHIVRKKSVDITVLSLILFSSVAALSAVRYIPFYIAVALPITKDYRLFHETALLKNIRKSSISFALALLFFIFAIFFGLKNYEKMFSIDTSYYPDDAAHFLLANRMDTHIFNQHNKGSYLLWKLYPYYKVFNDTRFISLEAVHETDAIAHALDNHHQPYKVGLAQALSALVPEDIGEITVSTEEITGNASPEKPLWKKLLEQYKIDLIVHEACAPFTMELYPLTLRLLKDDDWVLIYLDGRMMIFVRNTEKYAHVIDKFTLSKELIYDEIIFETAQLVRKKVAISTPYSSLAFALLMKKRDDDAKIMIDASLALDDNDLVAHFSKAYLALKQNVYDEEEP